MHNLVDELSRIITYNSNIVLSAQQTVIIFKVFSLFKYIIDKSTKRILKNLFRQTYQEEFKYESLFQSNSMLTLLNNPFETKGIISASRKSSQDASTTIRLLRHCLKQFKS